MKVENEIFLLIKMARKLKKVIWLMDI